MHGRHGRWQGRIWPASAMSAIFLIFLLSDVTKKHCSSNFKYDRTAHFLAISLSGNHDGDLGGRYRCRRRGERRRTTRYRDQRNRSAGYFGGGGGIFISAAAADTCTDANDASRICSGGAVSSTGHGRCNRRHCGSAGVQRPQFGPADRGPGAPPPRGGVGAVRAAPAAVGPAPGRIPGRYDTY